VKLVALSIAVFMLACGPGTRPNTGDDGDDGDDTGTVDAPPMACVPTAESCADSIDNDCDGLYDCRDPDCSGIGDCPVCGTVQHPQGTPFPLPDGEDGGGPTGSYESKLNFTGFPANLTFAAPSNLVSVCVNMEHSWLRDLQIELVAPSGQVLALQEFLGQTGAEIFMGMPNDSDGVNPVPGVGADYCWIPVSLRPAMLVYANQVSPGAHLNLPAGNYASAKPVAGLIGATLNGDWTLRVTDLWGIDNGFIFSWSIAFDPTLVQDCSTPPIQ
jgi:subtilisin-like proprotein convertase family protein